MVVVSGVDGSDRGAPTSPVDEHPVCPWVTWSQSALGSAQTGMPLLQGSLESLLMASIPSLPCFLSFQGCSRAAETPFAHSQKS